MRSIALQLDPLLEQEFATVVAILKSDAATRNVDALILSWVKYEKQLRRLFSYLVFQHPQIDEDTVESVLDALANNNSIYPGTLIRCIADLHVTTVPELVGSEYTRLWAHISRIQGYRNKIMHGQNTGSKLSSRDLARDVGWLIAWVGALAKGATRQVGYDGLGRNTYRRAKASGRACVDRYPFAQVEEFKTWLDSIAAKRR